MFVRCGSDKRGGGFSLYEPHASRHALVRPDLCRFWVGWVRSACACGIDPDHGCELGPHGRADDAADGGGYGLRRRSDDGDELCHVDFEQCGGGNGEQLRFADGRELWGGDDLGAVGKWRRRVAFGDDRDAGGDGADAVPGRDEPCGGRDPAIQRVCDVCEQHDDQCDQHDDVERGAGVCGEDQYGRAGDGARGGQLHGNRGERRPDRDGAGLGGRRGADLDCDYPGECHPGGRSDAAVYGDGHLQRQEHGEPYKRSHLDLQQYEPADDHERGTGDFERRSVGGRCR